MTDLGNKINELINKKDTKKFKSNLTKKYDKLFNDYKSIIQVKNPKVYDLIMTGKWNDYELDFIQRFLKKTYDDNASEELKQKDNDDRLKYNSSKPKCISNWKNKGMRSADWNSTYDLWLNCKNCEICDVEFLDNRQKRLDHLHNTELIHNIRWVLCSSCNNLKELKNYKPIPPPPTKEEYIANKINTQFKEIDGKTHIKIYYKAFKKPYINLKQETYDIWTDKNGKFIHKVDDKMPQPILHSYIRYFKTKFKKDLTEKDYDRLIYKQKYYNELEIATTEDYNKYQQYFTEL
jgi:hypothetical protein